MHTEPPAFQRRAPDFDDPRILTGPVPSPCISICRIQPASGLCEGCGRSLNEITVWGQLDDADKREVWQLLRIRLVRMQARRICQPDEGTPTTGPGPAP